MAHLRAELCDAASRHDVSADERRRPSWRSRVRSRVFPAVAINGDCGVWLVSEPRT